MQAQRARTTARALILIPFFAVASIFVVLSVIQLAEQTFVRTGEEPTPPKRD